MPVYRKGVGIGTEMPQTWAGFDGEQNVFHVGAVSSVVIKVSDHGKRLKRCWYTCSHHARRDLARDRGLMWGLSSLSEPIVWG